MSVYITVNGKFAKHCTHPLLVDAQDAKKAEEKERRKLRLLQVREESKKLAKKIRDEVNEEKKKELQKLHDIQQKELECWRQHALQQKSEEYREAIFQVGAAHEAARTENQQKVNKQKQPQGSYKNFKKQMATRKSQPGKVKFNCQSDRSYQQTQRSANKQSECNWTRDQYSKAYEDQEVHKRKRNVSFSSSASESEDEAYKDKNKHNPSLISLSSTSESTSSSCELNQTSQESMFVPTKNKCLIKTPSVNVDLEVGSDDSVTISAPVEITDNHCRYNRQFRSVIRLSPRKERCRKENNSESSKQTSSTIASTTTSTLSKGDKLHPTKDSKTSNDCSDRSLATTQSMLSSKTTEKEQDNNKISKDKSQTTQFNAVQISKEKRFTIISELVKKQQENDPTPVATNEDNVPNSRTTSATITSTLSPRKATRENPIQQFKKTPVMQSPRKISATSKSSRTVTQPLSSLTTAGKSNSTALSSSGCSGRVQFYDYRSKLAKEQDQSASAVTVQRQRDQNFPSAMEQAEQEKQKEKERRLEELKRIQQMEERGQKALEREQIRRDCNELTEKLEVLAQEYGKQIPINDNQLHIFADKQLRKEGKMNSAIEKLLQRPSIITCSEQTKPTSFEAEQKSTVNVGNSNNILNLASLNNKPLPSDDVTSDSCCSILLGYVDDQSKLIKQDIQKDENRQNQSKQKRLRNLLKRLDSLRVSLLAELKNECNLNGETLENPKSKVSSKEGNLKQVIDGINELRTERECILSNEQDINSKSLREREKLLKAKEELLERKVREFFELQKQPNKTQESQVNENIRVKTNLEKGEVCTTGKDPLEIVITVKGDTKCVQTLQKPKRRLNLKKAPSKISTLIKSPQASLTKVNKHTPKRTPAVSNPLSAKGMLRRQNSYDSSSTSYMSLPPELPTKINDLAQAIAGKACEQRNMMHKKAEAVEQPSSKQGQLESESSLGSLNIPRSRPPPRVNPLVAQYVHRLLGMSRNSVQKLGVSSSDIETPNSSVVNIPENIAHTESHVTDEHLVTLQSFIEENKNFIKDLEQSIKSQNNVSLEDSLRKLDDIWRKRLKSEKKAVKINENIEQAKDKSLKQKSSLSEKKSSLKEQKIQQTKHVLPNKSQTKEPKFNIKDNLLKDLSKSISSHSSEDKDCTKNIKQAAKTVDKAINAKLSIDSSKSESDAQIARYAKLTENCTHRIAELTQLINRVRKEKQRLLEVTLSSASENGRHSTEYLEFPEGKTSTRTDQSDLTRVSSSSEETTQNKQSVCSNTLQEIPKLSSSDKNKHLAYSRDSGIADSRPVTALENRNDPEPLSQTSSESAHLPQVARKIKPPPTLKRFSPQLPEDELAHELSTIFEVDTPATSRINTAIGQSGEEKEEAVDNRPQEPIEFPTFEQYVEKLNLDITQLSAEQNSQLQQEFTAFLECLQQNRLYAEPPQYAEFPSLNAYLKQLAECDFNLGETLEESLVKLHISGIQVNDFPAVREYIQHNISKTIPSESQRLLDTGSLENITDAAMHADSDTDTISIDYQEELKKRNIIKKPFRTSETKHKQIFSSTTHKDEEFYQNILAAESGIEKLSTSGNTSALLDDDLKRLVKQYSLGLRNKSKEAKALSSTTTSTNVSVLNNSPLKTKAPTEEAKKESGRSFNLRDFLTRELKKLANNSDGSTENSTTTDDSLRSHFLHSLLGSLTPITPGTVSKSAGHTLDRQKTSTPVPTQPHSTASAQSSSSSQLFSGESRISSVHYNDRSGHFISSGNGNADQSSE